MSLSAIHMPARIYPLPLTKHEYLSDAASLLMSLAGGLQLIQVVGIHHSGVAIDLNLGPWKLQFDKLAAALCELRCALEDRIAILPGVTVCIYCYRFLIRFLL